MSEPIIIETPTTTRERLVLVPVDACSEVREGDPRAKLGAKVGLTVLGTYARDATAADLERAGWVREMVEPTGPGTLAHLRADLRDAVKERDELRHHYDAAGPEHNLLALLDSYEADVDTVHAQASEAHAMVVAAIGSVGAETIEAAVARLVADRGALLTRAEKAERALRCQCSEPGDSPCRVWGPESTMANARRAIYRLGVAHERARHVEKDRATDEELVDLYRKVYETHGGLTIDVSHGDCRRAAVRAVAARVRQEQCLVAQAVAANVDIRVAEDDGGGFMVGAHASGRDEELERAVLAADVPATLARLLGEVSRG